MGPLNLAWVSVLEKSSPFSKSLDLEVGGLLIRERTLQLAYRTKTSRDVGAGLLLVSLTEVVEVFISEERITGGPGGREDTTCDGKKGHSEGSSTAMLDNDKRFATLIEIVSNDDGGGLVGDADYLKTDDCPSILSSLTVKYARTVAMV